MKKATCAALAVLLAFFLLAGCGEKTEISHTYAFADREMKVTVNVSDGWDVEFSGKSAFVYDNPNKGQRVAVAFGTYNTPDQAADHEAAAQQGAEGISNVRTLADGSLRWDEGVGNGFGQHCYLVRLSDEIHYLISVNEGEDAESIFQRFRVELVEKEEESEKAES